MKKGSIQMNELMVPLWFLGVLLLSLGGLFFSIFQDKQRIRAYLQRRGATQIQIHTLDIGSTRRGAAGDVERKYAVTYRSATGQPCVDRCVSKGSWMTERAITWGDGMSDLYDLVPDPEPRRRRPNA